MSKTSIDNIDLKAVFNQDISKMIDKDEVNSSDFYNPAALMKKDKKTSYNATLKFIPWLKNIPESRIQKWQIFLKNPDKTMTKRLDCATTLGDKQPSILKDIYFALDGSSSAHEKHLASNFGRKKQIFTLVQIIDDKQHPELIGKIKIWNFGVKVNDKIKLLMKPDADSGEEPNNPYDIVNGKLFALKIQNVTTNDGVMPNYDNSYFYTDRKGNFLFENNEVASKNPKDAEMKRIATYILENQPDLEQCAYHRWEDDEELAQYVYDVIMETIPRNGIFDKINKSHPAFFNSFTSQEIPKAKKPSKIAQIIHEEVDGDDEDEDEDESEIPVVKTKIKPILKKATKVVDEDEDEDKDDEDEDEDDSPIPTFNKAKTLTKKVVVEEDEDEDDEDEILVTKSTKQQTMINNVKKVNSKKVVEEDDEDEDEDEDDPVDLFIKKKKSQSKFQVEDKFFD